MSEMDGLELIQQARKTYPGTAIVAMSDSGYLNVAKILGARGVLEKPIPADLLLHTIREAAEYACETRVSHAEFQPADMRRDCCKR